MAGLVEITGSCQMWREPVPNGERVRFAWTSDSGGNVKANIMEPFSGFVYKIETTPYNAPTASYDITLLNEAGQDVLLGKGIDRSSTASETAFVYESSNPEVRNATAGRHRLRISAAGASKSGTIVLTILESAAGFTLPAAGSPISDGGGFESPGGFE